MEREVSPKQVVANQANCRKSTGPKTPEGKARASRNALKTGAYAKTDNALREIMLRRGENPADFEQLHQELTEAWQPDDVMQAMLVKTIAEKSWDKAQLRAAWMESQLTAMQVAQIQAQRRELLARRWLPGALAVEAAAQGLWQAKDSPSKFKHIFDLLDLLQKWFEDQECPDEYPAAMTALYGECPSLAGERIRELFIEFYGPDEAAAEKALLELPKWIAQERRDVQQERDLYQREMAIRGNGGANLREEQVAPKEAALERQIAEQTRLLLQLKTKRSQWGSRPEAESAVGSQQSAVSQREAGEASPSPTAVAAGPADVAPAFRPASSASAGASSGQGAEGIPTSGLANGPNNGQKGDETVGGVAASAEKSEKRSNEANQVL
jgi:hypothetical protein